MVSLARPGVAAVQRLGHDQRLAQAVGVVDDPLEGGLYRSRRLATIQYRTYRPVADSAGR